MTRCLPLLALLAFGTGGCRHQTAATTDDDQALAEDGSDVSAIENDTQNMSTSLVGSTGGTLGLASAGNLGGGELTLNDFGDAVRATYLPSGCVTATNDVASHTATYVFVGCAGPFGLRKLSGTVKVTYTSPKPLSLVLDFAGTGLKVNAATVDWTAHAEITAKALGAREMVWSAQMQGTTARGRELSRTNQKTVAWTVGGDCISVSGESDGKVASRGLHTDVISFSVCKGACPSAGSEIRVTNTENGKSIDFKYDGGPNATYTGPEGHQADLKLACNG